jgi:aspartate aminotransferase
LEGPQDEITRRRAILTAARAKVAKAVSNIPGLSMQVPEGTFYAYIACNDLVHSARMQTNGLKDDRDIARYLLDEAGVVVLPGEDCGLSPFFRINFACAAHNLDAALARIGTTILKVW